MKSLHFSAAVVLALLSIGCTPAEEASAEPEPLKFEGKPDEKFVAKWVNAKNKSFYDLKADGSFRFEGKVTTQGGTFDNKFDGEWAVTKDDVLLFKDANGAISDYTAKVEGNTLSLTSVGSLKTVTVLTKE